MAFRTVEKLSNGKKKLNCTFSHSRSSPYCNVMVCTIHFNFCCFFICDVWPLQLLINNSVFYYNIIYHYYIIWIYIMHGKLLIRAWFFRWSNFPWLCRHWIQYIKWEMWSNALRNRILELNIIGRNWMITSRITGLAWYWIPAWLSGVSPNTDAPLQAYWRVETTVEVRPARKSVSRFEGNGNFNLTMNRGRWYLFLFNSNLNQTNPMCYCCLVSNVAALPVWRCMAPIDVTKLEF